MFHKKKKESSWHNRFQNIKVKFFVFLKKMFTLELISSL